MFRTAMCEEGQTELLVISWQKGKYVPQARVRYQCMEVSHRRIPPREEPLSAPFFCYLSNDQTMYQHVQQDG